MVVHRQIFDYVAHDDAAVRFGRVQPSLNVYDLLLAVSNGAIVAALRHSQLVNVESAHALRDNFLTVQQNVRHDLEACLVLLVIAPRAFSCSSGLGEVVFGSRGVTQPAIFELVLASLQLLICRVLYLLVVQFHGRLLLSD